MRNGSPETEGEHDRGFFRVETRDAIKTLSNFLRGSYKEERRIRELAKIFNPSHITVEDLGDQQVARVTQMMLEATLRILANDCQTSDCHHDPSLVPDKWTLDYMAEFGHFMLRNLEILLRDGSGVHVMVTVIEVLGGVRVGRHWSRKTMGFAMRSSIGKELEKDNIIDQIPDSFSRILRRVTQNLIITRSDRYLRDVILGRGTSLIQNLLFILRVRSPEVCQTAAKRLVEVIFANPDNRKAITTNSVSAYLVEAIMLVADHNRLMYIWKNHLRGHLSEMWRDDIANFVVQRLIDAAQEIELFGEICDEMLPKLGTIFACNRPGIGVCLAKAAERFPEMQELFISALMRAFNCFEPKERQIALVSLMLFGDESPLFHRRRKDPQIIWLHGSLMLQYIFRYKQPELVSNSLLSLSARRLVNICNDKSGSHIIDCFLLSSTVTERDKNIFKEKLRGHYAYVASDRFGTRVIESLLAHSDLTIRNIILDELANHDFQSSPDTQNNSRNNPNISVKRRHSSPSSGKKRVKESKN